MTHVAKLLFDGGGQYVSDPRRRMPTQREIINRLRKRRYTWGKTLRELADESGIREEVLRDVLLGKPFTEVVAARLVGYLTTPAGPAALVRDLNTPAANRSRRFLIIRRIIRLGQLARRYGIWSKKQEMLKEWTEGRLLAYFYNLDSRLKAELMKRNPVLAGRFNLPDGLDAWEWIERLEQLHTGKLA